MTIVALGALSYFHFRRPESNQVHYSKNKDGICPGSIKTMTMADDHLRGVLERGEKFKLIENFYDCNPVKRGDLIYYQYSDQLDPVVKIVTGIPGDNFILKPDLQRRAWNIYINGKPIKSVIQREGNYFFGGQTSPTLSLFSKTHQNTIWPDELIALSTYSPGDNDSGIFGMVKLVEVVGKVVKEDTIATR
jgi:hypothetical protein